MHPDHDEVPYAINRLALSYFNQIRGVDRSQTPTERALAHFQRLVERYPDSEYVEEARKKIEECKDILAGHEFYVGKFYYRTGAFESAVGRFKRSLERFPGHGPKEDAMLYLGKSYIAMGDEKKGREVLERLVKAFPGSEQAEEARILLEREE